MQQQYIITWKEEPVKAQYIRIRKLHSEKKNWATVRSFRVNPVNLNNLGFDLQATDTEKALLAFDKHPGTSYTTTGTLCFGIPKEATTCTLLTKLLNDNVVINQLAADGSVLSTTKVDTPFVQLNIVKNATQLSITGSVEIFEVIFN